MTQAEVQAKFDKFLSDNNGKYISSLGHGTHECFDEAVAFTNILGVPHYPNNPSPFPYGNASQIYTDFGPFQAQYFTRIANTPDYVPQKADMVIWASSYNGGAGHVGTATGKGDTNTFECFEQNDPLGSVAHLKTYNYNSVLGALRLKVTQGTTPQPPMNDPRAGYFDQIWHARYGQQVDTPKVTQAQIDNHIAWTQQERNRASVLDQVRDILWPTNRPDSNKLTAQEIVDKAKSAPSDLKQKILDLLKSY